MKTLNLNYSEAHDFVEKNKHRGYFWNSWDIVSAPQGLLQDIVSRVLHPGQHMNTWMITLLLGVFLNMVYQSFKTLRFAQGSKI